MSRKEDLYSRIEAATGADEASKKIILAVCHYYSADELERFTEYVEEEYLYN